MSVGGGDFSEQELVEKPTIELFEKLGFQTRNCFHELFGPQGTLGRDSPSEVILISRLRPKLLHLNPDIPKESIETAIEELTRDRSSMSMVQANKEIYLTLKSGIKVSFRKDGEDITETVRVIDWDNPRINDLFLASQFWISGEMHRRRADLVGFVNGIPLIFLELKAAHRRLEDAYRRNLTDYKDAIPKIFWYNGFIVLSNGSKAKIGTLTAGFQHFNDWKKINKEGEVGIVSLDTLIRGTCEPLRLIDLLENFVLYQDVRGSTIKILAMNHQYLGVNNAIDSLRDYAKKGRLGVFWHTQGSGKSFSMIFFAQKVLRKLPGNYTFVVVTDREDLDDQIYENFASTEVITEKHSRAENGQELKRLLREDHRYVFTLIQKFRTEKGAKYPELSDRSDIIVMTDEAHRSQYDIFALNMRNALPNASFIGFTATPLMVGEEKTRHVFGDYVSVYNFRQSVQDGATVPLFLENRIPELQLNQTDLSPKLQNVLEDAELDPEQEKKVAREFARQYHVITREDRLEKIAKDIVTHFMGRGYLGKAMVVSIDRFTAVRMYDKVSRYWTRYLDQLSQSLKGAAKEDRESIRAKIRFMEETDMAVVISQSQNEISDFRKRGLTVQPHRKRIVNEVLDEKFKDPNDHFRVVFVCAMWMTGFDAQSVSTIYLDKPMHNHTLMQTIARANRVFEEKVSGTIVDYVGNLRNIQKALSIYGSGSGGGIDQGDWPVESKSKLVEQLRDAVNEAQDFLEERGVSLEELEASHGFERIRVLDDTVDKILFNEESKMRFLFLAEQVNKLFKAILPDDQANQFLRINTLLEVISEKIHSYSPIVDISEITRGIEGLLDSAVIARDYEEGRTPRIVDLSKIDFDDLRKRFSTGRKHIEAEVLKNSVAAKLGGLLRQNPGRFWFLERFQRLIDDYNSGAINIETFFEELVKFARSLGEEERRAISEGLDEEELTIFDLLTRPDLKLTKKEEGDVKKVARDLLTELKKEKIVIDWRKRQQTRAQVYLTIEDALDELPDKFTKSIYEQKCQLVYHHVYDSYFGPGSSVYASGLQIS
jgi:type I restriction enzyme R subunit